MSTRTKSKWTFMFEPRRCSCRKKGKTNPCVEVIIFHNLGLSVAKRKQIMDQQQKSKCSPSVVYYFTEVLHIKPEKVVKFWQIQLKFLKTNILHQVFIGIWKFWLQRHNICYNLLVIYVRPNECLVWDQGYCLQYCRRAFFKACKISRY